MPPLPKSVRTLTLESISRGHRTLPTIQADIFARTSIRVNRSAIHRVLRHLALTLRTLQDESHTKLDTQETNV